MSKIDLTKVAIGDRLTPCAIALIEFIRTEEAIYGDEGLINNNGESADRQWTILEARKDALEAQIKREIRERLGVDPAILMEALA